MSGVYSDQAFVDKMVKRIRQRFVFVPAWRMWFENVEGYWRTENAEARLRDEYRLTVEEIEDGDGVTLNARRKAINAQSQQAALWLLREEERLRARPDQIASRLKRPGSDSLSACARGFSLAEVLGNLPQGSLERFFQARTVKSARACAKSIPNVLIRTDHKAPDPMTLFPDLQECCGERVIRVHWDYWHSFPESITPALALQMSGAEVCFLTGLESGWARARRFPQWHLLSLVSQETAEWTGKDGAWHALTLPPLFVLCGPPVPTPTWELELRPHLLCLTSLRKETE